MDLCCYSLSISLARLDGFADARSYFWVYAVMAYSLSYTVDTQRTDTMSTPVLVKVHIDPFTRYVRSPHSCSTAHPIRRTLYPLPDTYRIYHFHAHHTPYYTA